MVEKCQIKRSVELRIRQKERNEYEDFTFRVLKLIYPDLRKVKLYGNHGDWACDGFSEKEGVFIQVYAPDSIIQKNTTEKINRDIKRIYEKWAVENNFNFKKWLFAVNDKYKGIPAWGHALIKNIREQYKIETELLTSADIEQRMLELYETNSDAIITILDDPFLNVQEDKILEFSSEENLNKVLKYILDEKIIITDPFRETKVSTETEKKIVLNNISTDIAKNLKAAIDKRYLIKDLCESDPDFDIEEVRKKILRIYEIQRKNHTDMNIVITSLFKELFDKFPERTDSTLNALFIVLGYFFEICDIGDKE